MDRDHQEGHLTQDSPRRTSGAWVSLVVIAAGLFLAVTSTTMVSVSLPSIEADLHATASQQEWIVDVYVIVYSSLLVAGGVMGDRRGRKGLFMLGVAIFGAGALVAGLAPNVPILLAGRALQGLGPALLVPGSLTIIRAIFTDDRQRNVAIGLWSTASGVALAVGPALGGVLVETGGWRWVFLFNVPLTVALVVLAGWLIPRLPRGHAQTRFDWVGAVMTIAGIALLAYATIEGPSSGWGSLLVVGSFVVGGLLLVALVFWERRVPGPLIQMELFTRPAFIAANLAATVVFFAFVGGIVYFSIYFQRVQHHTVIITGLEVSAIGVAFALAASQSGRIVDRVGAEIPMIGGLLIAGGSTLLLLRLGEHTPISAIWWNFALLGGGIGVSLTPMTSVAMSSVGASRAGMVSAIHNALRQVGQVFGVAVLGVVVYAGLSLRDRSAASFGSVEDTAFIHGLHNALVVSGIALIASALFAIVLFFIARRDTPNDPELVELSPIAPNKTPDAIEQPEGGRTP
jgi:DHA2 family methylenomycin A resistance protein-like MFS transporter